MRKATQAKGLAKADELYLDRTQRARELQKEGKKVIGYMCCFPPVEMITALDMVPLRIMGDVNEPITKADSYVETIMCSFVRSCFDLAMKGKYDFLDGLVIPHSCDTVLKIYDLWTHYKPLALNHYLDVPHMLQPASAEFFKVALGRLQNALEQVAGAELTDEKLCQAIELHNQSRALLRQLYHLRKIDPPLITGREVIRLVTVAMTIPVREANELIQEVIKEVGNRQGNRSGKKPARVMVYGTDIDNEAFIKLVEDCGANVVVDDICTGTKAFWHDVEITEDLLDGLVDRYLFKTNCARTYRESPGNYLADMENRFGYIRDFARDWQVDGVVLYVIRFCDTVELDVPDVRDYLQGQGYPVLHIEDDYMATNVGQLKTRIQAFLETIS